MAVPSGAVDAALGSQADFLDFAVNIGDWSDTSSHTETVDISGVDRFFVQVHSRGLTPFPGAQVRVLLLLADASTSLAALPSGYAARINSADTSNWPSGSGWMFADSGMPYRLLPLPGRLDLDRRHHHPRQCLGRELTRAARRRGDRP